MRSLCTAGALVAVLSIGAALPSHAATMSCTSPSCFFVDEGSLDPTGDSFQFGRPHSNQLPPTAGVTFNDYYTFSISGLQTAFDGSFTLSGTSSAQLPTGVVATLYQGMATLTGSQVMTGPSTDLGSIGAGQKLDVDLGSGSYYLYVTGMTGIKGGNYSGTASVSAVPLPASAPMFGAALVALGGFGYGLKRKAALKSNLAATA